MKCVAGCELSGQDIEVHCEPGNRAVGARLSEIPWPGTTGLYWAEIELVVPALEGTYQWEGRFPERMESGHAGSASSLRFVTVKKPEHRIAVEVVAEGTPAPVTGAQVRLGVYRAATNAVGRTEVEVPKGSYKLNVWKSGYALAARSVDVSRNTAIRVELAPVVDPEDAYWK